VVALIQPISYEKDARNTEGISKTLPAVDSATSIATMSSDSEDTEENETWIQWFCRLKGNEFFCEVRLCFFDTLPPSPPLSLAIPHPHLFLGTLTEALI
jgi:hypothetical protein